ncbi:MAG TPA: HAMP domain-containing histidine kinase [Candidatus Eisenbacteria bacterium]|uniref:histidine kinase n=1 Tax=Eiseniibacteriota bacterium TaxID=2212470 RepID=A0A7V2ATR1_UNCEI|nr:HAMP domain-containing histidine kinase [Candidatus Eisenbacteria bacterium]
MRAPKNLSFLLKIYIIAGSIVIVSLAIYYNHTLITRMQEESVNVTRLFSRFIAIELPHVKDQGRFEFIGEVLAATAVPYILTDAAGRPMIWSGIDVPPVSDGEYSRLLDFDPLDPNDALLERVLRKAQQFDRMNEPILIESESLVLILHFGPSKLSRELARAPYVQLGVLVLFVLFGFIGFRAMKVGEQRSIWVGLAKETAHQLGTPISSIMGWVSHMKDECASTDASERMKEIVEEVSTDVGRLSMISDRFSKIGSRPKLEYQKIAPIIEETVGYFERRRPSLKMNSTFTIDMEELPFIRCSKELLGWVFENLIKNSLDAIAEEGGKIHIKGRMDRREKRVVITFTDNGRGMNSYVKHRIFSPGFTTKERGWGLGLALVKRIVEEYHRGTIKVAGTQPNKGTTFQITFPID